MTELSGMFNHIALAMFTGGIIGTTIVRDGWHDALVMGALCGIVWGLAYVFWRAGLFPAMTR